MKIFEFSRESLSTASIAQVHEAKLISAEHVAVKVQKDGIAYNTCFTIKNCTLPLIEKI